MPAQRAQQDDAAGVEAISGNPVEPQRVEEVDRAPSAKSPISGLARQRLGLAETGRIGRDAGEVRAPGATSAAHIPRRSAGSGAPSARPGPCRTAGSEHGAYRHRRNGEGFPYLQFVRTNLTRQAPISAYVLRHSTNSRMVMTDFPARGWSKTDVTAREIFEARDGQSGAAQIRVWRAAGDRQRRFPAGLYPASTNSRPPMKPTRARSSTSTRISALARARGMPVVWTRVAYKADAGDAGVWGTRTNTPDFLQNIKYDSDRHAYDPRCEIGADDLQYTKRMPSAFFETPLASYLVWHKVDTVVVTGGIDLGLRARDRGRQPQPRLSHDRPDRNLRRQARQLSLRQPDRPAAEIRRRRAGAGGDRLARSALTCGKVPTTPNCTISRAYRDRPPVVWPGGKSVAVWVAPNLEYYEIDPPAHPQRKAGRSRIPTSSAIATATTATACRTGGWRR